jgi:hypothetical protein
LTCDDGARLIAERVGIGVADQRAFLAHIESTSHAQGVADALARRD